MMPADRDLAEALRTNGLSADWFGGHLGALGPQNAGGPGWCISNGGGCWVVMAGGREIARSGDVRAAVRALPRQQGVLP